MPTTNRTLALDHVTRQIRSRRFETLIGWGMLLALTAFGTQPTTASETLANNVRAAHNDRLKMFDNGHFVWHEKMIHDGDLIDFQYELWAREGQFYRLDVQKLVNGRETPKIQRTIVRPEGFVNISANSKSDPGAIVDFGQSNDGLKSILGRQFVATANRTGAGETTSWLDAWERRSRDLVDMNLSQSSEGDVKIMFVRKDEDGTKTYNAYLASDDYRVLRWTYRFDSADGTSWATNEAELVYHPTFTDLVTERSISVVTSDSGTVVPPDVCLLVSYDPAPAALSMFDIGSMPGGHRPTQNRRLITFAVGVLLLSGWIYYRKRSQHR